MILVRKLPSSLLEKEGQGSALDSSCGSMLFA
jgi:hypothetical protein